MSNSESPSFCNLTFQFNLFSNCSEDRGERNQAVIEKAHEPQHSFLLSDFLAENQDMIGGSVRNDYFPGDITVIRFAGALRPSTVSLQSEK
jgi:hypothetical protein